MKKKERLGMQNYVSLFTEDFRNGVVDGLNRLDHVGLGQEDREATEGAARPPGPLGALRAARARQGAPAPWQAGDARGRGR